MGVFLRAYPQGSNQAEKTHPDYELCIPMHWGLRLNEKENRRKWGEHQHHLLLLPESAALGSLHCPSNLGELFSQTVSQMNPSLNCFY